MTTLIDFTSGYKLHYGCGTDIKPGFVNVDAWLPPMVKTTLLRCSSTVWMNPSANTYFIKLDRRADLSPLQAGLCAEIRSTHALEHLNPTEVYEIMGEFQRLLKPTGTMSHIVPDFDAMVNMWRGNSSSSSGYRSFDYERYLTIVNGVLCPFAFGADFPPHRSLWSETFAMFLMERWGFSQPQVDHIGTDIRITCEMPDDGLPYNTIRPWGGVLCARSSGWWCTRSA
jgi:predicted SAM-dependent methyltransferase